MSKKNAPVKTEGDDTPVVEAPGVETAPSESISEDGNPGPVEIRFFVEPTATLPTKGTSEAAGWDIYANLPDGYKSVTTGQIGVRIPTGLYSDIPAGHVGFVCSRSGLACKGVFVVNAPGVVDSDYRGEWQIILGLLGGRPYLINHGDRIAQVVFLPFGDVTVTQVDSLEDLRSTARGAQGFGSTGQ